MIDIYKMKKVSFKLLKREYGDLWSDKDIREAIAALYDCGVLVATDRRGIYRVNYARIAEIEQEMSQETV